MSYHRPPGFQVAVPSVSYLSDLSIGISSEDPSSFRIEYSFRPSQRLLRRLEAALRLRTRFVVRLRLPAFPQFFLLSHWRLRTEIVDSRDIAFSKAVRIVTGQAFAYLHRRVPGLLLQRHGWLPTLLVYSHDRPVLERPVPDYPAHAGSPQTLSVPVLPPSYPDSSSEAFESYVSADRKAAVYVAKHYAEAGIPIVGYLIRTDGARTRDHTILWARFVVSYLSLIRRDLWAVDRQLAYASTTNRARRQPYRELRKHQLRTQSTHALLRLFTRGIDDSSSSITVLRGRFTNTYAVNVAGGGRWDVEDLGQSTEALIARLRADLHQLLSATREELGWISTNALAHENRKLQRYVLLIGFLALGLAVLQVVLRD